MNNKSTIVIISSIVGVLIISLVVTITLFSKAKKDEETKIDSVYSRMSRLESGIETILDKMAEESNKEEAALKTPPSKVADLKEGEISEDIKGLEESPEEIQISKVDKSLIKEEKIVKEELKPPEKEPMSECIKYKKDLDECLLSPLLKDKAIKDFNSKENGLESQYLFDYLLCSAIRTKNPVKYCKKLKDKGDYNVCIGVYDAWRIISSNEATCDDDSKFDRICNKIINTKEEKKNKLKHEDCIERVKIMCNAIKQGEDNECNKFRTSKEKIFCKKLVKDYQEAARLSLKKGFGKTKKSDAIHDKIQNSLAIVFKLGYNNDTCEKYLKKIVNPYYCKNKIPIPQNCKEVTSNE